MFICGRYLLIWIIKAVVQVLHRICQTKMVYTVDASLVCSVKPLQQSVQISSMDEKTFHVQDSGIYINTKSVHLIEPKTV